MKESTPQISVVLCSRNRSEQVSLCLQRFDIAGLVKSNGELVLVDNGSSDKTREIFNEFQVRHPGHVQTISVAEKGLSIARNIGVQHALANLVVFLDDDVYLEKNYLAQVIDLFSTRSERLGVIGGRILRFDPEDSLYCCQLNEKFHTYRPGSSVRPGAMQGANFAIRKSMFIEIGGFDECLGAGQKYRCEDIDFIARALQAGWSAVYEPALVVYHHHGRRDGEDVESLRHDNSYASGAFFAKMLGMGYGTYWKLLFVYLLSAPVRPNMKLVSFLKGWRDYRGEYPPGAPGTK